MICISTKEASELCLVACRGDVYMIMRCIFMSKMRQFNLAAIIFDVVYTSGYLAAI